jgi:hypothetical protein
MSTVNLNKGCQPQLEIALNKGSFHQQVAVATSCESGPLLVHHATTLLPVSIDTTYGVCTQLPPFSKSLPRCLGSGPPPLPVSTYMAKVFWAGAVPLPEPGEIALALVG